MSLRVRTSFTQDIESRRAGRRVAEEIRDAFGQIRLASVLVYATVNHDQPVLLAAVREVLGEDVQIMGASTQGVMTRGKLVEAGFVVGAMGFGGSIATGIQLVEEVQSSTREKGRSLGRSLKAGLQGEAKVILLHYDPLCGVDAQVFLDGLHDEVGECPVVGGAAGQPWGRMIQTFQYFGTRVLSHGAVAMALDGPFGVEIGVSHGTSATGVTSIVTRADKNVVLEIDDRPALDVMRAMTGCTSEVPSTEENSSWAIGLPRDGEEHGAKRPMMVRAVFGYDFERRGVVLQAAIAEGTSVMFHHRTVESVMSGTREMALDLSARLHGRRVVAGLGFECAARVAPFLGEQGALDENLALQRQVAPEGQWLGMIAWGEVAPWGDRPGFHNYTYPVLLLTEPG